MRGEYVDGPDRRPRVGGGPPSRRCSGDPSRLGRSSRSERRLAGEERQAARCGVPRALAFAHGRRRLECPVFFGNFEVTGLRSCLDPNIKISKKL